MGNTFLDTLKAYVPSSPSASALSGNGASPMPSGNGIVPTYTNPISAFEGSKNEEDPKEQTKSGYRSSVNYNDDNHYTAAETFAILQGNSLYEKDHMDKHLDRTISGAEDVTHNTEWKIYMDADGDGTMEDVNLADASASSFDSELDLYIEAKLNEMVKKYGHCSKQYLSDVAILELASYGIRVDAIGASNSTTNRSYSFSLIDVGSEARELMKRGIDNLSESEKQTLLNAVYSDDAKVMEDAYGKKGSIIFSDCIIPDGYAQGAEINLSSILDLMGYDCISKADFIGNEAAYFEMLNAVEQGIYNGEYDGENTTVNNLYGNIKSIQQAVVDVWGGGGSAPGVHGHAGSAQAEELMSAIRAMQKKDNLTTKKANKKEELMRRKMEEYQREIYQQMIEEYKTEHDGKIPSAQELQTMKQRANNQTVPYSKIEEFEKEITQELEKQISSLEVVKI